MYHDGPSSGGRGAEREGGVGSAAPADASRRFGCEGERCGSWVDWTGEAGDAEDKNEFAWVFRLAWVREHMNVQRRARAGLAGPVSSGGESGLAACPVPRRRQGRCAGFWLNLVRHLPRPIFWCLVACMLDD